MFNACSSECFGDTKNDLANEMTKFNPSSPYAIAKATSYWLLKNYREVYNLHLFNGILFNHESILRLKNFLSQKIIHQEIRIFNGENLFINFSDIDNLIRDWGWGPEYVEAMWIITQADNADDYIIATGISDSLRDFIKITFEHLDLDYKKYFNESFEDIKSISSRADPSKINNRLKWKAKYFLNEVIKKMIDYNIQNL